MYFTKLHHKHIIGILSLNLITHTYTQKPKMLIQIEKCAWLYGSALMRAKLNLHIPLLVVMNLVGSAWWLLLNIYNNLVCTVLRTFTITSCTIFWRAPQDLDGAYDNSSVIAVGSVIQLFCSASGQLTAPHIQWTRNNITIPETEQLPHLMVKSRTENNTITSSLLTIYGFSSSDNGSYQCVACDNNSCNTSIALLLSGW